MTLSPKPVLSICFQRSLLEPETKLMTNVLFLHINQ